MKKALFLIVSKGLPNPRNYDFMSADFKDFVRCCTIVDPIERLGASELIKVFISSLFVVMSY